MFATAVTALATGMSFSPLAPAVTPQMKLKVLAGNDISLVKCLIHVESGDKHIIECHVISVMLKESNPRLPKM